MKIKLKDDIEAFQFKGDYDSLHLIEEITSNIFPVDWEYDVDREVFDIYIDGALLSKSDYVVKTKSGILIMTKKEFEELFEVEDEHN